MGAQCCTAFDEDGFGVMRLTRSKTFMSRPRPSSYDKLRVLITHAPIDSTNVYQFWVEVKDPEGTVLKESEHKKCPPRAQINFELEDLPEDGEYSVQLMTPASLKNFPVRGEINVKKAAVSAKGGDWAEVIYEPIIPNEWFKSEDRILLRIAFGLDADAPKSKISFKALDENGKELVTSAGVKPKKEKRIIFKVRNTHMDTYKYHRDTDLG